MRKVDKRRKAVLIIQCDTETLTSQNLAVGEEIFNGLKTGCPTNPIELIKGYDQSDLLEKIRKLHEDKRKFRSIVIIAHGNSNGLIFTPEHFTEWQGIAAWLTGFKPKRLMLLACEANTFDACGNIFLAFDSVDEVFGSPFKVGIEQRYLIMGKIYHVLKAKKENETINQLMGIANMIFTRNLFYSRKRNEYEFY